MSGSSLSQSDLRYISCLWHLYFAHQLKGSSQIKFLVGFGSTAKIKFLCMRLTLCTINLNDLKYFRTHLITTKL